MERGVSAACLVSYLYYLAMMSTRESIRRWETPVHATGISLLFAWSSDFGSTACHNLRMNKAYYALDDKVMSIAI